MVPRMNKLHGDSFQNALYGVLAAKRDLAHMFFKFSNHFLFKETIICLLQLLSYALEISQSIMELGGLEIPVQLRRYS